LRHAGLCRASRRAVPRRVAQAALAPRHEPRAEGPGAPPLQVAPPVPPPPGGPPPGPYPPPPPAVAGMAASPCRPLRAPQGREEGGPAREDAVPGRRNGRDGAQNAGFLDKVEVTQ